MDELDTLLAEADALLEDLPPAAAARAPAPGPSRSQRCVRPLLAPPPAPLGRNTGAEPARGCSALRCTGCDRRVVVFEDGAWGARAEYLFFRNRHPDVARLREALEERRGARAYCCQCQWATAEQGREPPRNWVCGKH